MFSFFKNIFNFNEQELKKLRRQVEEINALEEKTKRLKDTDFPKETEKLKRQINGEKANLEQALPWAFALCREAGNRILGERHYDVQLMAGIALHSGKVAEQKTGEGKTLSATAPLYLNALLGQGAHLVTVNDYLARRDAGWMGQVYNFLGLKTAAIISEKSFLYDPDYLDDSVSDWRLKHLKPTDRKSAYLADITYGINSEFGFDYLRDNMAYSSAEKVQRDFYYAVIDEVDSVLIDEARTPHIISAPYEQDVSKYYRYASIVDRLMSDTDYVIDEKMRTANLTEHGIEKIEKILGVKNVYESEYSTLFHIEAALKAKTLFKNNKDYIVRNNEVIIVDEFTGRLLEGRRFSEGIHQAIEAKENVPIQKESKTLATISLQNYFRKYEKLAGMTGTAATEAEELHKIYKLDVVILPTNKKMIRTDYPDYIYKTQRGKFTALVEEIAAEHAKGRPILVGTTSIEKNEILSSLLRKKGIKHELLNAKNHEREAAIIAAAGQKGAVTIATNMAGRGVDIILGGEAPNKFKIQKSKIKNNVGAIHESPLQSKVKNEDEEKYQKEKKEWQKSHDEVVKIGGLYVIGTERHESRRIDNQLRGRSGRQGDPGQTRFFISLEDEMLRIFGGEQISKLMTFFNFPENQPIEHSMVSKAIEQAQVKVEGFNFDSRKHLLEFDDVLNKQRDIVYTQRDQLVNLIDNPEENVREFFERQIEKLIAETEILNNLTDVSQKQEAVKYLTSFFLISTADQEALLSLSQAEFVSRFKENLTAIFADKQARFGEELFREATKVTYLSTIDYYWTEHLTSIDDLREGISLRGYAQLDPLVEYKKESFRLFNNTLSGIRSDFFRRMIHLEIEGEMQKIQMTNPQMTNQIPNSKFKENKKATRESPSQSILDPTKKRKLGRNDPCWCGAIDPNTGKVYKYKKCGLINAPYHKG